MLIIVWILLIIKRVRIVYTTSEVSTRIVNNIVRHNNRDLWDFLYTFSLNENQNNNL
jgi:hypothetical protein